MRRDLPVARIPCVLTHTANGAVVLTSGEVFATAIPIEGLQAQFGLVRGEDGVVRRKDRAANIQRRSISGAPDVTACDPGIAAGRLELAGVKVVGFEIYSESER